MCDSTVLVFSISPTFSPYINNIAHTIRDSGDGVAIDELTIGISVLWNVFGMRK